MKNMGMKISAIDLEMRKLARIIGFDVSSAAALDKCERNKHTNKQTPPTTAATAAITMTTTNHCLMSNSFKHWDYLIYIGGTAPKTKIKHVCALPQNDQYLFLRNCECEKVNDIDNLVIAYKRCPVIV